MPEIEDAKIPGMISEPIKNFHFKHPFRKRKAKKGDCISDLDADVLVALVGHYDVRDFLEIGTHVGETASMLAAEFPAMRIVTCDPGDQVPPSERNPVQAGEYRTQDEIGSKAKQHENVRVIKKRFREIDFSGIWFDCAFVDGDHRPIEIVRDTEKVKELLRSPGVIIWHDVKNLDGVLEAIDSCELGATHVEGAFMAYAVIQ